MTRRKILAARLAALALPLTLFAVAPPAARRIRRSIRTGPNPSSDEVLVHLTTKLGEPRHYCLDIPGYPATLDIDKHREAKWALEAHTCKLGIANQDAALLDMYISRAGLTDGRIKFSRLDACM
jgi:hypothetical protein